MSGAQRTPRPWVGDRVHDEARGREAIVTDVQSGRLVLRALYGTERWVPEDPDRLTVVVAREERQDDF
ncbi:hypothetical protein [Streptomyces sp. TS71-3]|uniref:hypothetical protein n=1 Tax=Streptomyces sp. TS71-3 TaxID=2733862 RepID=UPI001B116BA2|nr:hypothetical protein [Streptomyces sp. TS71-3]GHJ37388.1 hypothetical protein Sm713_29970 [Streptomyces sp. TS71-3]